MFNQPISDQTKPIDLHKSAQNNSGLSPSLATDSRKAACDAVAAARYADERFSTCIENMLDCFGIFSAMRDASGNITDFRIDYLNAAACANNKMPLEHQLGRGLCELLPAHRTN